MTLFILVTLSLVLSLISYPKLINFFKLHQKHQSVSQYALDSFKSKEKTPTMGGLIFVFIPLGLGLVLIFTDITNIKLLIVYASFLMYALIGFLDDYKILVELKNHGLSAKFKFALQILFALILFLIFRNYIDTRLWIPILNFEIDLGFWYFPFMVFMLSGASNAVNITDGMDGLAGGTVLIALSGFLVFATLQMETTLLIFILMIFVSLSAFLIFNLKPARIYMGDVGSLSLGALLASLAIVLKQELVLIIISVVFIYETLCVILQIGSVKLFKRRIFKYTPIHYSFILSGMREQAVVLMFWLLGALGLIIGLWVAL